MTYPGLQKILNMISQDPSSLIIDRYVSLVKDLNNEQDKIVAIQELANIMIDIDPQETLKYALCVFENNQSLDSLKIIYKAVLALGKSDKASVIKKEIERLEKIQLEEHKIVSKTNSPNSSSVRPSVFTQSPSINEIFKDNKDTSIKMNPSSSNDSDPTVLLDSSNNSISSLKKSEFNSEASKTRYREDISSSSNTNVNNKKTTILPPIPDQSQNVTKVTNSIVKTDADTNTDANTDADTNTPQHSDNRTSIIQNTSNNTDPVNTNDKNEPSDNNSAVLIELFDFYWKNGLYAEAKNLLDSTATSYSTSSWWLARFSAISKKITDIDTNKDSSLTQHDNNSSILENEQKDLDDNVIFWNNIDNMMKEGNYRKALSNIRSTLFISLEKDSSWALSLYQRLNTILDKLGYINIDWDSSLDEKILYNKVISYIPQKISATLIF